jgi:HD-like signal output (HDOD) protein
MKGLHGWLRLLENNETAVLSTLLSELDRVTSSDKSSGEQLAEIILKDPFLTSKIIRVANSVLFNPNELPVTTVSRAVINIGFKNIRSMCLSIKVLESLLDENSTPLLLSMLARSLHAASQAKSLCLNLCEIEQEEVFVATLLCHLAELLVLGHQDEEVKLFSKALLAHSTDQEKDRAAEKYLGVSLTRLAKTLIKQWRMQGLILEVVNAAGMETESRMVEAVRLGNEISRAALLGWDSPEFRFVSEKVAEFQGGNAEQLSKQIIKVADQTSEMITSFGKKGLVDYMPTSKRAAKALPQNDNNVDQDLTGDRILQRETLIKLSELLRADFNINHVISLVLDGLNKGVGLQRVALAVFDKAHCRFVTKYTLGTGVEGWKENFSLCFDKNPSGFLFQLFQNEQVVWIGSKQFEALSNTLRGEFTAITGQNTFFIAPLKAESKIIGFIYADMGNANQALNLKAFDDFNEFISKTNLALNLLARRK